MKKILTKLVLSMVMLGIMGQVHAQSAGTLGKSEKVYDAGKAMVYAGSGTVLAGLTFSALSMAGGYDGRGVDYAPFAGLVTAGVGGVVALAGIPVMLCGRADMRDDGSLLMSFSSDQVKGWSALVEFGGGLPYLKAGAGYGYNFSKSVYLGASLAAYYDWFGSLAIDSVPVYADARFTFGNRRVAPYISVNAGYDLLNSGVYTAANYGVRIRKPGSGPSSWWIASNVEYVLTDDNICNIGVKVGYMF